MCPIRNYLFTYCPVLLKMIVFVWLLCSIMLSSCIYLCLFYSVLYLSIQVLYLSVLVQKIIEFYIFLYCSVLVQKSTELCIFLYFSVLVQKHMEQVWNYILDANFHACMYHDSCLKKLCTSTAS